ncbi:TIGR03750 family conjugal transfer protein [Saezia sanguinis]|uniref:TIGR03750 family conjugal transfer protein n=1 Tax=Saezia sanguinis TaxID=1965230 RepID=UPI0030DCEA80
MPDGTVNFLPHRLNRQPSVVRGLTADELWITAGITGIAGLIVGIPLAMLIGQIAIAPTMVMIAVALGVLVGGTILRRQKRGRPDTWLYRQIQWQTRLRYPLLCAVFGGNDLIGRSGYWSIRRTPSHRGEKS